MVKTNNGLNALMVGQRAVTPWLRQVGSIPTQPTSINGVFSVVACTLLCESDSTRSILVRHPIYGLLVIMGARRFCKPEVRVRFSYGPPYINYALLVKWYNSCLVSIYRWFDSIKEHQSGISLMVKRKPSKL